MTTEEPTSFRALCDAYEAAPAATRDEFFGWLGSRAEFLEWLERRRLANAQQRIAQLNKAAEESWLEPLPWDDD